jgi:hypothetical protein
MDTKTIEHIDLLLERYFNAETTLEEEARLRAFFCSDDVPARLEQWRNLFVVADDEVLGDDFDSRILAMIDGESHKPSVKARVISMRSRLMPLFKAAAVVAIILTLGGALQAPFDSSWQTPDDYAALPQPLDSVAVVSPIQAENISEVAVDSTLNMKH